MTVEIIAAMLLGAEVVTITPDTNPATPLVATVDVFNRQGSSSRRHVLPTAHGDVILSYSTITNVPCDREGRPWAECADHFEIEALPDGLIAVPMQGEVMEDGTVQIQLFVWNGG